MAPASRDDADRLPLEQVVGPRLGAGRGHPAVRLDDARPAADEEQRRLRLAVGGLGEQQPGVAGRRERVPDVAVGRLGPDQEARPGPRSRGRSGRTRRAGRRSASTTVTPPVRALLTYWRHFLRRSPHSAVLVGAQVDDPRRVRLDRAAPAASRPPGAPSRSAPSGSSGPSASISGSIRRWLTAARAAGRPSRTASVNARDRVRRPGRGDRAARRVGEPPRHRPRAADEDLGADRAAPGRVAGSRRGGPTSR